VRLAGLARQTGISRATLYRQFDGKDGLATALLTREGDRFLLRIDRALEEATSWESGLRDALVISLAVRDDHPLLASALVGRGDVPFALQTVTKPLVADARSLLAAFLRIHRPGLAAPYLDDVADTLVRATMSHLISPDDAAPAVERLHRLSRHLLAHPPDAAVREAHRPTA
jgi:AcrR family transcriptional regulator